MGLDLVPRDWCVAGLLLALVLTLQSSCSWEEPDAGLPQGTVTLKALSYHDDLGAASLSLTHGVTGDSDRVGRDWELTFGIDDNPDLDVFAVRHTPDDLSFIVDLGPIDLGAVPTEIDVDSFGLGLWGDHDHVPVVAGHMYAVRTLDADSRSYGVVQVLAHRLNRSVVLRWQRSVSPDRLRLVRPRLSQGAIYLQEDFEDGAVVGSTWKLTGDWEWGMPRGVEQEPPAAFSGTTCLGTLMGRSYSYGYRCLDNLAISPVIDLRGAADPVLAYRQWLDLPGSYDGASLWIRRGDSGDWKPLYSADFPYSEYSTSQERFHWNTDSEAGRWRRVTVDLLDYVGERVQIGWSLYTDGPYWEAQTGIYVDDVVLGERASLAALQEGTGAI